MKKPPNTNLSDEDLFAAASSITASDEIAQNYARLIDEVFAGWTFEHFNSRRAELQSSNENTDPKKMRKLSEREFQSFKKSGRQRAKEPSFFHLIRVLFEEQSRNRSYIGISRARATTVLKGNDILQSNGKLSDEPWVADSYASNTLLYTAPFILRREPDVDQRSFRYLLNDKPRIDPKSPYYDNCDFLHKMADLFLSIQRTNTQKNTN